MEVKIDTKEKFTVITPITLDVSANIAADLVEKCKTILTNKVKNLILNLEAVTFLDEAGMEGITQLQQEFYENNASFVVCCLSAEVEKALEEAELLDLWNITPTVSEAWDIVQMEEIERELLDGDDISFPSEHG
ncbi:MAG: STAS domain-containing protein [Sediminibacterium sp.]|nr:STAS domain-containing protein [Sediminibacterium sp.]MBX9780953.1 STAS domain-containing protein [Chitinophagaceae bacterium]